MEIHSDDMVAAGGLQHVGDELRRNGGPALILLVLPCVGEVGDNCGDSSSGGGPTSMNHDQQLHQTIVDVAGSRGLQDEDCRNQQLARAWDPEKETPGWNATMLLFVPSSSRIDSPTVTLVS